MITSTLNSPLSQLLHTSSKLCFVDEFRAGTTTVVGRMGHSNGVPISVNSSIVHV